MERISVYIDGANFYHSVKNINERYSDFYFDFLGYIKHITKGKKLGRIYYFVAPLKQEKNPDIYRKQQIFLGELKRQNIQVILCKRRKRATEDGGEIHKIKEDDIRLALQMQKDAYENRFDIGLLISGDGDFVPLPEYLKEKGKKVQLAFFENSISISLRRACDFNSYLINKKILNQFFNRNMGKMFSAE